MKIAFFSETGVNQKYQRDFPNARTEVAWCLALNAPMCSLQQMPKEEFQLGIVIIPKSNPNVDLNHIRKICKKVAVMQEGPHWYFQDYTVDQQFNYFNTLIDADWVYCHNESDLNYYKGLGCKEVRVMRSLMITDGIEQSSQRIYLTMIGGNFVNLYGGFDSYMVAREIEYQIYAPSMGRKQKQEDLIEDITYLPYLSWRDWLKTLSQFSIGVHLMRTHAAGTFALNCGFHGIPCIGYKGLDTQEILHPHTTVNIGDLKAAKEIIHRLKADEDFYKKCRITSLQKYENNYSEKEWKWNWRIKNEG